MPLYLLAGDSLTEGVYGESYVERIARALQQGRHGLSGEVVNAGWGGDTIASLVRRIDKPLHRYRPQWLILAIGSNDVWYPWLSSHSPVWWAWLQYRGLWAGQSPATDLDQFAAAYRMLIDRAQQLGTRVLLCTVGPLGERLSTPLNRRVARLNGVIKHVAAECKVPVADVWQAFVDQLATLPDPSGYLAAEWLFSWVDRRRAGKVPFDTVAQRRRLHLTFDGIHLNSRGADLWAETVLRAVAQAQGTAGALVPALVRRWELPYFQQGPLQICCTPGWEVRAHDLAERLADAYGHLADRTGARPSVHLAVLGEVHWNQSPCPRPYPEPAAWWGGESGTLFVPEAYEDRFLRALSLPETVAARGLWPSDLAQLGEPARATVLADLLAVQELSSLFLHELRVAPADPALHRLLAAYLTQVVLHAAQVGRVGGLAPVWNAWGEALTRAGIEEGRIRLQARALFQERGEGLVASFTVRPVPPEGQGAASLGPGLPGGVA
jgi:lysophospholipase L1-like esterase